MTYPKKVLMTPISALDFVYALAKHSSELKFDKGVSQSAARIQMISHHMSKPCKAFPCPSDFHNSFRYFSFHLFSQYTYNKLL